MSILEDRLTDDVIIAEAFPQNEKNKVLISYFKKLCTEPEFTQLLDLYNHKKATLSKFDERIPEYVNAKNNFIEQCQDDYSVIKLTLLKYKLNLGKELFPFNETNSIKR